jgi:hypothetical protein
MAEFLQNIIWVCILAISFILGYLTCSWQQGRELHKLIEESDRINIIVDKLLHDIERAK